MSSIMIWQKDLGLIDPFSHPWESRKIFEFIIFYNFYTERNVEKSEMITLQYEERCIRGRSINSCRDLKIIGDEILENWWRVEWHRVDVGDMADILAASPEVLVVGMGYVGLMEVSNSLRSVLKSQNIELIATKTDEAVKAFNQLHSEGRRVAGAFHLTC